jgi:hypothetical protein
VTTGTDTTSTPCAVVTGNSRYFRVISASDNTQNQPLDFHSEHNHRQHAGKEKSRKINPTIWSTPQ